MSRRRRPEPDRLAEPANLISHHTPEATFRLADVRRYDSGAVILHYQPS